MESELPSHQHGWNDPVDRVDSDVSRKHWTVPVRGVTCADVAGIVRPIARHDGTVILHLSCGDSHNSVQLYVCDAVALSTGIWEAAGSARPLTAFRADNQFPPPENTGVRLVARHPSPDRSAPRRDSAPRIQSVPTPAAANSVSRKTVLATARTIGLRIQRVRHAQESPCGSSPGWLE